MCSFGVTNISRSLLEANHFARLRGPDGTNTLTINDVSFLHNLLHITRDRTPQPFVKDDVVVLFNGEIYNHRELGNDVTEVEAIHSAYRSQGINAFADLDGEFAICIIDFPNSTIVLSTDTFATKPLWYQFNGPEFGVASYKSQLSHLGFTKPKKLGANKAVEISMSSGTILHQISVTEFSTKQYKSSFDDWNDAFSNSIAKRTTSTQFPIFIGLSSGYDSGAIACELHHQGVEFKSYSIPASENEEVIRKRLSILGSGQSISISLPKFYHYKLHLKRHCEEFSIQNGTIDHSVQNDPASVGLAAICNTATSLGAKIYLSGPGQLARCDVLAYASSSTIRNRAPPPCPTWHHHPGHRPRHCLFSPGRARGSRVLEFTVQPAGTPLNDSWHRFLCASVREWMEKICEGTYTSAISR